MNWTITGTVSLKVRNIQVELVLPVDWNTGTIGKMTKFDIDTSQLVIKDAKLDVDNLPAKFKKVVNGFMTTVGNLVLPLIAPFLEGPAKNWVNDNIAGKTIQGLIKELKDKA